MERKNRLLVFYVLIFFAGCLTLRYFCFSTKKIEGTLLKGEPPSFSQETLALFKQPYFYLSKGRQCFVFVSLDGKTVIKFFNYDRFRFPSYLALTSRLKAYAKKRSMRFQTTFNSLQIAEAYLKEETGLIALHLQKSNNLPFLTIFDPSSRCRIIDLNRVAFLVQKRALPLSSEIYKRKMNDIIDAYCSFLKTRCEKKISDDDRDCMLNFGFDQNRLINLDPGRLFFSNRFNSREGIEKEIRIATKRLHKYLMRKNPKWLPYLEQRVEELNASLNQSKAALETS